MRTAGWVVAGVGAALVVAAGALLLTSSESGFSTGEEDASPADSAVALKAALAAHGPKKVEAVVALPYRIEGKVLERGQPVAGVRVTARRTGAAWDAADPTSWHPYSPLKQFRDAIDRLDDPKVGPPDVDVETRTAADGTFSLAPKQKGMYEVAAAPEAPRLRTTTSATVTESRPTTHVALAILSGSALAGRVVDAADRPLGGVVDGSWELADASWWTAGMSVRADPATGEFVLPAVPAGKGTLAVRVPGRGSYSGYEVTTPFDGVFVIRVGEGGAVVGRVTDKEGRPVAGVDITVSTAREGRETGEASASQGRGKSGPDGGYRVAGLVPGKVSGVSAFAEGFVLEQGTPPRAAWSGASVVASRDTTIDLVLSKGGSVHGRVTEAKTGRPIAKATVSVHRADMAARGAWTPALTAVTADDGTYRVDGVPLSKWLVVPASPTHYLRMAEAVPTNIGYRPGAATTAPPELTLVLTREGEDAERNVEMLPGFPVRGRVVGPQGEPVAGARIHARNSGLARVAWQWGVNLSHTDVVATSEDDGTFVVPGMAPREDWILQAKKEPMLGEPSSPVRVAAGGEVPEVTLKLTVGASIAGRVLDADGSPMPGVTVGYWMTEGGYPENGQVNSDGDGGFLLEGVPAGNVQLNAWGAARQASATVSDLKPGERRTGVELRYEPSVALSGVLVDQEGKPVAGKNLTAQSTSGPGHGNAITRSDGTFTFPAVLAGKNTITLSDWTQNRNEPLGTHDAPATDLRLVAPVPKTTLVSGRVIGPDGSPVPLCSVAVTGTGGGSSRSSVGTSWGGMGDVNEVVGGEFRREVEGTAPFEVAVTAPRDANGRALNLRVKKERVTDPSVPVVVSLDGGLEVAGRVVGPDDVGIEGVRVTARSVTAVTDETGAFVLAGLESGHAELAVQAPPRFLALAAPVRARVGDRTVLVRLSAGRTISGRALGPDGRAVGQAQVTGTWKGPPPGQAYTNVDAAGRWKLEGLPETAGLVDVRVQAWGMRGGSSLRPGEAKGVRPGTDDVVITLVTGVSIAGTLVGSDGKPPTEVYIQASRDGDAGSPGGFAQPNADGTFEIGGLAPGTHVVRVTRSRSSMAAAEVRIEAPSRSVRIEVPPQVRMTGRLEGSGDLSKFRIGLFAGSGPSATQAWASTDADGAFQIDVSAGVAYRVTASKHADDRYGLLEGATAGAPVSLRLVQGESIEGVVEGVGGAEQRAGVSASNEGFRAAATVEADGRFRIRGLPPGRYRLDAWVAGKPCTLEDVETGARGVRLKP